MISTPPRYGARRTDPANREVGPECGQCATSGRGSGGGSGRRRSAGRRPSWSAVSGVRVAAEMLPATWAGLRAPGMTTETPGWSRIQRSANWAIVAPAGSQGIRRRTASRPVAKSTPEKVSPTSKASPCRLYVRWSSSANVVFSSYLPESRPLASGTRAMMPTPAACAAGRTSSSGFRRNAFRMICTRRDVRPRDRGQRLGAGLDTDAVRRDAALVDQSVERVEDRVGGVDRRRRAVQLHQVDRVDAEVLPGAVVPGAEVRPACSSTAPARPGGPSWSPRSGPREL